MWKVKSGTSRRSSSRTRFQMSLELFAHRAVATAPSGRIEASVCGGEARRLDGRRDLGEAASVHAVNGA